MFHAPLCNAFASWEIMDLDVACQGRWDECLDGLVTWETGPLEANHGGSHMVVFRVDRDEFRYGIDREGRWKEDVFDNIVDESPIHLSGTGIDGKDAEGSEMSH
jgi:hypothetical protein